MANSSVSICRSEPEFRESGSPEVRKSGSIVCSAVGGQSALTVVEAGNPLKLIPVRGRGLSCTVCVATYGGGFVAGDTVELAVAVERDARLMLTTQANGKVYRSDSGATAVNTVHMHVDAGALLVSLPDPLTPFAGSRFRQRQYFALNAGANVVALDWLTAGRIARKETWAFHSLDLALHVHRQGKPWVVESLRLDPEPPARWAQMTCLGSCIIAGPMMQEIIQSVLTTVAAMPVDADDCLITASPLDGGCVLRFAATRSEIALARLRTLLTPLTPLLGHDPWAGRN